MKRFVWVPASLCLLCVCGLAAILAAPPAATALAPPSSTPDQQVWVTNGTVKATVIGPDGTTYIGGDFTSVGPNTGGGAALNATSGAPDMSFPAVSGTVSAAVPDGSGGYYIGGDFTKVGGLTRNHIAHILADGAVDASFNANVSADGTVRALAVSGSIVYAGGRFTSIGGQSRNNIAALNASSGLATAWNPNATRSGGSMGVYALAVSGSTVYAGGDFTSIGGQPRNYIAALAAGSGLATAWNPNANQLVLTLAVSGSTVYTGGYFTSIGGQPRNHIAALAVSSGLTMGWNPNANNEVYALAVSGSTVYAGGYFTAIGGQSRNRIAALDASAAATAWDPNANAWVGTLAVSGATVYAGGGFTTIGGQTRNKVAALSPSSGVATVWNPNVGTPVETIDIGPGSVVVALAVSGSTVYAGGDFTSVGGQTRNNIAALNGSSGAATAWDPNADGEVGTLAVSGSTVYAGGGFTTIGGQTRNYVAALDASGAATAWNPNANSWVRALAVSGSTVYAGGYFTTIGGQTRNNIAALDAGSGLATAWDPNANGDTGVAALVVSGSTVYAGGGFTTIGGQTRNHIAALDASGAATAWNPNASYSVRPADSYVFTLAVSGATVYAGGYFTTIGGQTRNNIAALDAGSGLATAWDPNAESEVYALAVSGATVYAGGGFSTIGGQTRNHVAALDAGSGLATAWDPNANQPVIALAVSGATVCAGGSFKTIGERTCGYLARFSPLPSGSMSLNGGSAYTGSTTVTITSALSGATQMRFRNAGSSWSSWMPYSAGKAWTLPAVAGTRTVYGEYRTPPGNALALSDSIILAPSLTITSPTAVSNWPSGSTQTVAWNLNGAVSDGEFRVWLVNAAGTGWYINRQVLPVAGQTAYAASFAADVPAADGYKAYVYWRPVVGTGSWTATARSAAFTVTPINITSPTAASSWPSGSAQSVTWTVSPAMSGGEFRVWLVNAAGTGWYVNKQVLPTAGKTSYSTPVTVSCPAAVGYTARVYWRATLGTGSWTATAASAAFTVTPVVTVTAPNGGSLWPANSTQTVRWNLNSAVSAGEFRVGLLSAGGTAYINKQVLPVAGQSDYAASFAVNVPAADYQAYVYYRPVVGTGSWTATARSAAFTVTPVVTVTNPTAASSWPSGGTQTVAWNLNSAVSAGEFRVWLVNAAGTGWYINRQVLPVAGQSDYAASFPVNVPAAAGYQAYVYYRPVVGTGSWTATARSAAFTVTPINITSPVAISLWRTGSTQTVAWTVNPAMIGGEFRVWLVNAAGTGWYINRLVLPVAGQTAYAASFAVNVPAAAGYTARVYWRAAVGSGAWTATAKSAAFTVTP